MDYIKVSAAAEKWGVSPRRVRVLCAEGKIPGVMRCGKMYLIPASAGKPADGRTVRAALFTLLDEKKARLEKMRPLTEGEAERLREEFTVDLAYNSNAIEGNALNLRETAMVLEGIVIDRKPMKDHFEAVGYRDAFLYVQDIAAKETDLTESMIKKIHALVLANKPQDKGVYRAIPVRIPGTCAEPALPNRIEQKMKELLALHKERERTMHIIERVARFHLAFEEIRPFIDGNGRTGRLLMNFDLMRNGYLPINIRCTDRKRYYDAFDVYYRDGNTDGMVELIAEYASRQFDAYFDLFGQ